MPRKPRFILPGYPHHVTIRGNNRSQVFFDDGDRSYFIRSLKKAKELTGSKILSYCLMTNHIHLIIEPISEEGLAKTLQSLGRQYVQFINTKYQRTGTLWEGRYKSSIVCNDRYLLVCSKYVELNPVRAGIVQNPEKYHWSSYQYKVKNIPNDLLDYDAMYLNMGTTDIERREKYKNFIENEVSVADLDYAKKIITKGGIVGNQEFIHKTSMLLGIPVENKKKGRPNKSTPTPFI